MTILTYLSEEDVGEHGLIAIPMIVGHLSQLFIDAYIANVWGDWANKEQVRSVTIACHTCEAVVVCSVTIVSHLRGCRGLQRDDCVTPAGLSWSAA
eukprot:1191251-Prorocentrum_minimum.AAC.1